MEYNFNKPGVAAKGGKTGGKISRRPRKMVIGEPLTSEEMLFMAEGISSILGSLKANNESAAEEIKKAVEDTSHLLMSGKWDKVFLNTLPGSTLLSLAKWKDYLYEQWGRAYEMLSEGKDTEDDVAWLRALRNVSEGYDVTAHTKTKWVKEAKDNMKKPDKG